MKPASYSEPISRTKRSRAMDHFTLKDGVLHCEDVSLELIADEVGTPVYVYSAATLRRHARVLKEALSGLDDPLIAYAVKANPNPAVLSVLAREGLGADIVSIGEYRAARNAGVRPDAILFNGGALNPRIVRRHPLYRRRQDRRRNGGGTVGRPAPDQSGVR